MALPPFLASVIRWVRAGYPEGVPDVDYIPLFALLGSQLSESDVQAIAEELENESKPESAEAIRRPSPRSSTTRRATPTWPGSGPAWPRAAGRWPSPSTSTRPTGPSRPGTRPGGVQVTHLGPTNSSSRATASRRATEIELRRE